MRFTLLNNIYDDNGDEKAKRFFQKAVRWIREATSAGRENWKKILEKSYGQYLVGSGGNTESGISESGISEMRNLYENCEDCSGQCSTCYVKNENKGVSQMTIDIDRGVEEAFNKPYQKPKSEDSGFEAVYHFTKDGIEQTSASLEDEKVYDEEVKKEKERNKPKKILTEAEKDEGILAAFS